MRAPGLAAIGLAMVSTAILGLLAGVFPAQGQGVRSASEDEMNDLLQGCWRRELTVEQRRMPNQFDVCFGAGGVVTTPMVTCSSDHGCSEFVGRGTYVVASGKLNLRVLDGDDQGWIFYREVLSCDTLISPGRAIKLMNCIDPDWRDVLPDMSYAFLDAGEIASE